MRWSLILSAFIAVQSALSFVCVALAIPLQSDGLERRAPAGLKLSSKAYRENAQKHPYAYHVEGLGPKGKLTKEADVKQEKPRKGERSIATHKLLNSPGGKNLQADHVFEVQMLKAHLHDHGIQFNQMDAKVKSKVIKILNGPKNMALIPGSINQSKGQLIKHAMAGKKIKPQPARDKYALLSYDTAHKTAKRLDKALNKHPGYEKAVGPETLQKKLQDTFVKAGLHRSPSNPASARQSSPASSGSSSSNQGHSDSRQSSPRPSTPGSPRPATPGPSRQSNAGPSSSSSNRGPTNKRQASPGNSPPKTRQKTGRK